MKSPLHICLLLVLLCPLRAQAQRDTTVVVLPGVEVEADRDRAAPATAPGRLTTLDAAAAEAAGARNVADLLEARSGLFVKRYGSGGLATLSLRGTGSAHTLLLLDGLRVADPQTGQVDLSLLPTVLLESVEVFHGSAAGGYGAEGLGGVVRLGTLHAEGPGRLKASGGYGAYGERSLGVVASGGSTRLAAVASAEVSRAAGDFPYRNETLFPPQDVRRTGADRSLATLFGRAVYRGARQRLSVAGWFNGARRGLPGPGNAPPGGARQWDRHLRLWAAAETRFAGGLLEIKGAAQRTWQRYANPAVAVAVTARTRSFDLDARARFAAGRRWLAVGGAAAGFDRADVGGGVGQTRLSAFVQGTGAYGRWLFYPALRFDRYDTEGIRTLALNPQVGVNVQPLAWSGLRLKGSAGRAFRAPTFNERFWQPGGNPDLKAERGWSADAGLLLQPRLRAGGVEAEVTFFYTRLRHQIVWQPGFVDAGVQVWRPANLRRVVTRGMEASLRGQLALAATALDGGLTFTLADARDRSDPAAPSYGQPLRYEPREQLKLHLGAARGAFRLDLSGRLVGPRFLTTDASMRLPAYRVFDAQLGYRRTLGSVAATLSLAVENLFDSAYSIVRFYPMPPRHARVRFTLDFNP